MATNPGRLVVPSRTNVYLADVGTAAPTAASGSLPTGWLDVGLTTEDSLSFSTEPEFQEVRSAQSDYPTLTFQTSEAATVSVDLQEWSAANFISAYGGGEVEEILSGGGTGTGTFKFTPPGLGGRVEKAAIVEVIMGTRHFRYIFPRVMQREGVQQDLQRGGEAKLPLRLSVQGGDAGEPWYLLTNDASAFDTTP